MPKQIISFYVVIILAAAGTLVPGPYAKNSGPAEIPKTARAFT